MAIYSIPTPPRGVYVYVYRIKLEGVFYKFQFRWNARSESWTLDIGNDSGTATVRNVRLVLGSDLLWAYRNIGVEGCPPGTLSVIDVQLTRIEAGLEDLGDRVKIFYEESTS